jgi:hypothetical protein
LELISPVFRELLAGHYLIAARPAVMPVTPEPAMKPIIARAAK